MTAKDRRAIEEFATMVRDRLRNEVVTIKIFGSKARGDDTPESDIDILVEVERATVAVENEIFDIAFDVNLARDVYISPRVIERAVFDDPVWRATPFIRHLQKEGLPV